MNSGFIYLHRKLKDHWIWKNPFYFQWFVYFLFRANYKDNKVLIGSDLVDVKKGQFITSIDNLTKDLNGATNQKIRTFLKLLEKDQMIIKKSTSKLTKITICNYDTYQTNQQTNNKPITNEQQTNNKPITTENKDNNKEIKNNNYKKLILSEIKISDLPNNKNNELYLEVTKAFQDLFIKNVEDAGGNSNKIKNAKGTWIDPIRLMFEVDNFNENQFRSVWQFLKNDSFWKKNILSTNKLRQQFNRLLLDIKNSNNGQKQSNSKVSDEALAKILYKHLGDQKEK